MIFVRFVAFVFLFTNVTFAQTLVVPTAPTCVATSFMGSVKRGLPFVQTIGSGLSYQLVPFETKNSDPSQPPNFNGWTIRIAYLKNRGEMEREFSESMTPPYHGKSPRDLGRSTSDLWADHTVYFPLNQLDRATAQRLRDEILMNPSNSDSTEQEMQKIPIGSAKWTVVGLPGEFVSGVPGRPELERSGVLDVSFKIDLMLPTSIKIVPELAIKAKPSPCPVASLRYHPAPAKK